MTDDLNTVPYGARSRGIILTWLFGLFFAVVLYKWLLTCLHDVCDVCAIQKDEIV